MNNFIQRIFTALLLTLVSVCAYICFPPLQFTAVLCGVLIYILFSEWPKFNLWWMTPIYPILPFLALIDLYLTNSLLWAWLVIIVAAYDTGAYSLGKLLGSRKIAPQISPGKTVQGLVGGLLCAGLISALSLYFLPIIVNTSIITNYLVGVVVGLLAFFGDLFESYLKRLAGLKDSGNLLPGHGGILDRIDGLLLVALIVDIVLVIITF